MRKRRTSDNELPEPDPVEVVDESEWLDLPCCSLDWARGPVDRVSTKTASDWARTLSGHSPFFESNYPTPDWKNPQNDSSLPRFAAQAPKWDPQPWDDLFDPPTHNVLRRANDSQR
jgi:hypothetical protein